MLKDVQRFGSVQMENRIYLLLVSITTDLVSWTKRYAAKKCIL